MRKAMARWLGLAALLCCTWAILVGLQNLDAAESTGLDWLYGPGIVYTTDMAGASAPLLPPRFERFGEVAVEQADGKLDIFVVEEASSPLAGAAVYQDTEDRWRCILFDAGKNRYVPYCSVCSSYSYSDASLYGDGRPPAILSGGHLYWLTDTRVDRLPRDAAPVGPLDGITPAVGQLPMEDGWGCGLHEAYMGGTLYRAADEKDLYLEDTLHRGFALFQRAAESDFPPQA